MRPVTLDREITVERQSVTQDATYGTDVVTWIALSYLPGSPLVAERFPAEIQDVMPSRDEGAEMGVVIATKRTRCRIRWRDDIDPGQRVILHGDTDTTFQIVSPAAEIGERRSYIEFMMERRSTDG